jgi:putative NIF3 family GTP cyclohydrolase 1 type 2
MTAIRFCLRRDFLRFSALMMGGTSLASLPRPASENSTAAAGPDSAVTSGQGASGETSIRQVIDLIIQKCRPKPLPQTVDTVKTGDPAQKTKGIVTTFMATRSVIEKTVQAGANLIITHEPTFWNHTDETEFLKNDPVYLSKRRLIDENKIVIWRCHDYWHSYKPDPVNTGLLKELGWEKYADPEHNNLCTIPSIPLRYLAGFLKETLKLKSVQIVGKSDMPCRRAAILVGASTGSSQLSVLGKSDIDVVIAGDINEWEGCEYVRDAAQAGINKGFIVLGHANSEEPGMKYLAEWLRPLLPGTQIVHIPATDPFALI